MRASSRGDVALGYDGNTSAVVFRGTGQAAAVESELGVPIHPPLAWDGSGLLVRIHELPGQPQGFSGTFELGESGEVFVPAWLEPYLRVLPASSWYVLTSEPAQP